MLNQLVTKYKNHPLLQEPISLQTSASAYADEEVVESACGSEDELQVSSSMMERVPLVPSRPNAPRPTNKVSPKELHTLGIAAAELPGSPLPVPPPSQPRVKALATNLVNTSRDSSSSGSVVSFPAGEGRPTVAPSTSPDGHHSSLSSTPRPSDLRGGDRRREGGPAEEEEEEVSAEGDEPFLVDFAVEEIDIDLSVEAEEEGEDPSCVPHLVGAYTEKVDVAETYIFPPATAAASIPSHAEELVTEFMDHLQTRHAAPPRGKHANAPVSRLADVTNDTLFDDHEYHVRRPYPPFHNQFHYAPTYLNQRLSGFVRSENTRIEDAQSRSELQRKSNFRDVLSSVSSSLAEHHRSQFWEASTSRAYYQTREDRQHQARERAQRELVLELCLAVKPYKRDLLLTLMMLAEEDNGRAASSSSTITLGQCAEAMNILLEKYQIRATRATRALCARIVGVPETAEALHCYKLEYATFASNVLEVANSPDAL